MNKKILITILIVVVIVVTIVATGISLLKNTAQHYKEIQFEDLSQSLSCINNFVLEDREKRFVINTKDEYQSLLNYKSSNSKCKDFMLPEIDFSQKTLLGKYVSSGGCSVDFKRKVFKYEGYGRTPNKKVVYSIDAVKEGDCKKLTFNMNWILVPKISSQYDIEFGVNYKNRTE